MLIEVGSGDSVADDLGSSVPVVLLGSDEEDGAVGLQDVWISDTESGGNNCFMCSVSNGQDESVVEADSHSSGLNEDVGEGRGKVLGVESSEESCAGSGGGRGDASGDKISVAVGLRRDDAPGLFDPVDHDLPSAAVDDSNHCELPGGQDDVADDCSAADVESFEEGEEGEVEILGEGVVVGVVGEFAGAEGSGGSISEGIIGGDVEEVGSPEQFFAVEEADFEVGAVGAFPVLDEHDGGDIVLAADEVLDASEEWGVVAEQDPVEIVEHLHFFVVDVDDADWLVGGVFELDDVEVVPEANVDQLVGGPELGVDVLVELDDLLVELGLGDIGSLDEEGDPVVPAVAVEVGGQEVVAVDEVLAELVDEDDDVDLVLGVNVGADSVVDQPHESALLVEGRVGGDNSVEPQPGELALGVLAGLGEGAVWAELLDFLPVLVGPSVGIEHSLVDFEQSCLLDAAVVLGLVFLLEEEGLEVDSHSDVVDARWDADWDIEDPLLIEPAQRLGQLHDNCAVFGCLLEGLEIEVLVLRGFTDHEDRLDVCEIARFSLVFSGGLAGLFLGVFEAFIDISEIESEFPDAEDGPGPAGLKGIALDDIPVVLDDHIDGEGDRGVPLSKGDADLRKAIVFIWWGGRLGHCIFDLDGGGDVLGESIDGDGIGVEPGSSEGWVEASSDGCGAEGRIDNEELVPCLAVPSLMNLAQLHLNDGVAVFQWFEANLPQDIVGVWCAGQDLCGGPVEDACEGEAEEGNDQDHLLHILLNIIAH